MGYEQILIIQDIKWVEKDAAMQELECEDMPSNEIRERYHRRATHRYRNNTTCQRTHPAPAPQIANQTTGD
jgi:hypothetical protein